MLVRLTDSGQTPSRVAIATLCILGLGGCGRRRPGDGSSNFGDEGDAGGSRPGLDASASGDDGGEERGSDGGAGALDGAVTTDAGADEPCPDLPIPARCLDRDVMEREWSIDATGDGTYFADQAPWRLGFDRVQGRIWIVRFRTEDDTYFGRVSAYGDSSSGVLWVSNDPCDPTFGALEGLVSFGVHGGGTQDFVVAKDDADAETLRSDPAYAAYHDYPQLRGGHCYYAVFENTGFDPPSPIDAAWLTTTPDTCGDNGGTPGSCYYLAFDMFHYLHDPLTGQTAASNVIDGLTR